MSGPLIRYVLTAAIRDRLVVSLLVLLAVGTSLSVFLGASAIAERGSFVNVFAGAGLRLAGVLGLVLFVVFFVRRSFESRDVEFLLSRPIGRITFLFSYAAAFSLIAIALGAATGLALWAINPNKMNEGLLLWTFSIMAENVIMVNTAFFFSMVLTSSATAAMVASAFYVLARLMGQLLGIIDASLNEHLKVLDIIMQGISIVMPRLDLMGQTSWLIYGPDASVNMMFVMAQGLIFSFLVLMASLVDLMRRQF